MAYKGLVRPVLEYESSALGPSNKIKPSGRIGKGAELGS